MFDLYKYLHPYFPIFTKLPWRLQKGWWFFKRFFIPQMRLTVSLEEGAVRVIWYWIKTPDSRSGMKGFRRLAREGRL